MLGEQGELENLFKQIDLRKLKILKFLSGLFLFTGLFAISLFIVNSLGTNQEGGKTFATLGINITIILSMLYIYLRGAKHHQRTSTLIAISFLLFASFLTTILYEADSSIVYLLIVTAVLLTSIVLSVRSAQILFGFSAVTTLTLSGVHLFELDLFSLDRFREDFSSNLMSLFFVWIITMIAKIGYDQIEHSYSKAIDYAAELEQTNKYLDRKVKKRSEQLEDSLKRQANAVYGAAVSREHHTTALA